MRDMASIVTIKSIGAIEGKDRIQKATFLEHEYEAVVSKSVGVGDLVVWIEADSILPIKPEWEFLRKRCYKEHLNGFLIKTMKMSGVKSWGLVADLSVLPPKTKIKSGLDVTDILGIRKYEPEGDKTPTRDKGLKKVLMKFKWFRKIIQKFTGGKDNFPSNIIPKSDEPNIKKCVSMFDKAKKDKTLSYVSVKMEGMSGTFRLKGKKLLVCTRNCAFTKYNKSADKHFRLADDLDIKGKLQKAYKDTGHKFTIQGEVCGGGIQKNIYGFGKLHLLIYKIVNESTKTTLSLDEMIKFCSAYGFETVPILERNIILGESGDFETIDSIVTYASEQYFSKLHSDMIKFTREKGEVKGLWKTIYQNEGIVIRGNNNEYSFKVKNFEYAEWF